MPVRDSIFLTGITGAIGSWLAREALSRGFHVTALVRDKDVQAARLRVEAALDIVGAGKSGRDIEIALGDVALKGLGMRAAAIPSSPGTIVHCAGCIEFHDQAAERSRRTNVDGTRHVLEFASRHRVPVVHVSTAYICGLRAGTVKEDELDLGQGFHNVYERTKCEGEKRVHQWSRETGLAAIVLRPSIVVGDSREGRTVRFNTLYDLMHAFERIAPSLGEEEIRVAGSARATKNLIPIDYFGDAVWRIISRGVPGTYHITNPAPVTVGEMRNVFARLFGVGRIRLVEAEEFVRRAPTRAERLYQKATEIYAPYMTGEPRFDRSNTDAALLGSGAEMPAMDLPFFDRLLAYARRADWGRGEVLRRVPRVQTAPAAPAPVAPADGLFSRGDERVPARALVGGHRSRGAGVRHPQRHADAVYLPGGPSHLHGDRGRPTVPEAGVLQAADRDQRRYGGRAEAGHGAGRVLQAISVRVWEMKW